MKEISNIRIEIIGKNIAVFFRENENTIDTVEIIIGKKAPRNVHGIAGDI